VSSRASSWRAVQGLVASPKDGGTASPARRHIRMRSIARWARWRGLGTSRIEARDSRIYPMVERGCCARWFMSRTRASTHDNTRTTSTTCARGRDVNAQFSLVRRERSHFSRVTAVRPEDNGNNGPCCADVFSRDATRGQPVRWNGRPRRVGKQISGGGGIHEERRGKGSRG